VRIIRSVGDAREQIRTACGAGFIREREHHCTFRSNPQHGIQASGYGHPLSSSEVVIRRKSTIGVRKQIYPHNSTP